MPALAPLLAADVRELLVEARERTLALVASVSDADLNRVHDPLMSPLVWDLGHIAAFEDLWLAQRTGALSPLRPDLAAVYDAAETPRAERGELSYLRRADALEYMSHLDKELSRLYVYASMLSDQDTRLSGPQGMQQEMQQIFAKFGAEASFIEPEILKVGKGPVEKAIAAEPRLKIFSFLLNDIFRRAPHTLSDAEEKLLADARAAIAKYSKS